MFDEYLWKEKQRRKEGRREEEMKMGYIYI
jgi:hypothetical protein